MDPFTDVISKVLWRYMRDDRKDQSSFIKQLGKSHCWQSRSNARIDDKDLSPTEIKDHEESQIAEVYENVKYFEQQRSKNLCNESVSGEKLSFKGKLGSSKCDDSVINCQIDSKNFYKENEIGCSRSIVDNKSFSFKNISNKQKEKNEENDTINDMIDSQNASMKSIFKGYGEHHADTSFPKLDFSNIANLNEESKDKPEVNDDKNIGVSHFDIKHLELLKRSNEHKELASFNETIKNRKIMDSPQKSPYIPTLDNNSRFMRPFIEEGGNCSMLGVIDDNSNNIENGFMFTNDKQSRHLDNRSISMMFKNLNSNTFVLPNGTPKKYEMGNEHIFDHHFENSNISGIFQNHNESSSFPRRLFAKSGNCEGARGNQLGTPVKDIEEEKHAYHSKSFIWRA